MYLDYYKLKAKPFQLSPDPQFFYGSKGHNLAMAYLTYGLSLAEGFIVITGDVGAGKTLLVRNLVNNFGVEKIVTAHLVSTQLDADDTLRAILSGFGLDAGNKNKSQLLNQFEHFLRHIKNEGKRALLVVDEAQNLTPRAVEELRMLSNFQLDNQPLLQSFLLGQPEFRDTIRSHALLQVRQRIIASYHLGPLSSNETEAYIAHRLAIAGWQGDPLFSSDAYAKIFTFTSGVPRQINTLCDRLMVYGFLEKICHFDPSVVDVVIADLQTEVAHLPLLEIGDTLYSVSSFGRHNSVPPSETMSNDASTTLQRLERRLDHIESALNRLSNIIDLAMVKPSQT